MIPERDFKLARRARTLDELSSLNFDSRSDALAAALCSQGENDETTDADFWETAARAGFRDKRFERLMACETLEDAFEGLRNAAIAIVQSGQRIPARSVREYCQLPWTQETREKIASRFWPARIRDNN